MEGLKLDDFITEDFLGRLKSRDLWVVHKILQIVSAGQKPSQEELEAAFFRCEQVVIRTVRRETGNDQ